MKNSNRDVKTPYLTYGKGALCQCRAEVWIDRYYSSLILQLVVPCPVKCCFLLRESGEAPWAGLEVAVRWALSSSGSEEKTAGPIMHQHFRHELDGIFTILTAFWNVQYTEIGPSSSILKIVDLVQNRDVLGLKTFDGGLCCCQTFSVIVGYKLPRVKVLL